MTDNKKPDNLVFEQRLGSVRVSIFQNIGKDRKPFHNTTITRRYQDGNGNWVNSDKFTGLGDLALLREATELATTWLRNFEALKDAEMQARWREEFRQQVARRSCPGCGEEPYLG